MPYVKTSWENETPQSSPMKFKITLADGTVLAADATIELITPVAAGTPLNSTNLNKIEEGIRATTDAAESLAAGLLSADVVGRATMADGFINLAKLSADLRFQRIAEFVADGHSQLDWQNIPQTFRHLVMFYNGKSTRPSSAFDDFVMFANGDTGNNYSGYMQTMGAQLEMPGWIHRDLNSDGMFAGFMPTGGTNLLTAGSGVALLLDYRGDSYKNCISLCLIKGYSEVISLANYTYHNSNPITHLTGHVTSSGHSTPSYPEVGSIFSLYGFN